MTFVIKMTSDWDYREIRTFNTLEELMEFQKSVDCDIIIGQNQKFNSLTGKWESFNSIEIYDDYRE